MTTQLYDTFFWGEPVTTSPLPNASSGAWWYLSNTKHNSSSTLSSSTLSSSQRHLLRVVIPTVWLLKYVVAFKLVHCHCDQVVKARNIPYKVLVVPSGKRKVLLNLGPIFQKYFPISLKCRPKSVKIAQCTLFKDSLQYQSGANIINKL